MNKERYSQIIDEAYGNYKKYIEIQRDIQKEEVERLRSQGKWVKVGRINLLSIEEFINKCKTDLEFSERWGLKIEERELSLEERRKLANYESEFVSPMTVESWDRNNIPTKLITVTYKDEKTEVYE